MNHINDANVRSIRSFIEAKNYKLSKQFYTELGFHIEDIDSKMCFVRIKEALSFYLQDYYVRDWVNNSMLFLEVENLDEFYDWILKKELPSKYKYVRITEIKNESWGREFFMHDPSGVLWHFGNFNSQ